jgi:hypothetical protein
LPTVDDALSYLNMGWSIIPVKRDKRPFVPWQKFQKERPTDAMVRKWWKDYPDANIAVITGAVSGIVAIDIDSENGAMAYRSLFGEIHGTCRQNTGKDGALHLIFKHPGKALGNTARQADDVDTRADGGYILVSPSIHPSGKRYEWAVDPRESIDDLMDLPKDVLNYFWESSGSNGNGSKSGKRKEKDPDWVSKALEGVSEGERDDVCASLAGYYLRLFNGDPEQTLVILEMWNQRNRPPMEWKQVRKVVNSIAKNYGKEQAQEHGAFIDLIERHIYPDGSFQYAVYVNGQSQFMLLSTKDLCDQSGFILSYFDHTKKLLPKMKAKDWLSLLNRIMESAVDVIIAEDETLIGTIREILIKEADRGITDMEMVRQNKIVVGDGNIYFTLQSLLSRLQFTGEKSMDHKKLGKLLRRIKCEIRQARVGGKSTRYWVCPGTVPADQFSGGTGFS